jgi:hypothetical protein
MSDDDEYMGKLGLLFKLDVTITEKNLLDSSSGLKRIDSSGS